ncbi:hypothetical protein ElyMa_006755900 [Elysia marginata]|uniref:Uncharacterized protein n=1 Tax=Elysia marginata TaxID=1093978 RepID=A0AAV4J0P2_9GAST|nr:hypothetical protein ElyMa_006755900 [Elysia marginata]
MGNSYSTRSWNDFKNNPNRNWHCDVAQQGFRIHNQGQQSTSTYVPKILSGINTQNILVGQESFDSFEILIDTDRVAFGVFPADNGAQDDRFQFHEEPNSSHLESHLQPYSQFFCAGFESWEVSRNTFYPDEENREPPPYSELPDNPPLQEDPPPPYSETESLFYHSYPLHGENLRNNSVLFADVISSLDFGGY